MKTTTPQRKPRTVTKPYQKHKADYKISVEHKMRKLKKEHMGASYVLYIEVRVKAQVTVARSRFNLIATNEDYCIRALENPLVKKFLEYEKMMIIESVKSAINIVQEQFSISDWLSYHRKNWEGTSIFEIVVEYLNFLFDKILTEKGVVLSTEFEGTQYKYEIDDFARMASIFSQLGHKEFDTIAKTSLLLFDFFTDFTLQERIFSQTEITPFWRLNVGESFYFRDIITSFLREIAPLVYESSLIRYPDYLSTEKIERAVEAIESIVLNEDFCNFMGMPYTKNSKFHYVSVDDVRNW